MGCNSCKSGRANILGFNTTENVEIKDRFSWSSLLVFIVKTMLFAISLAIILPILVPFSVYILFKTIYLNGNIDVTGGLIGVAKVLGFKKRIDNDYDEEGYDDNDYDEEDLVMMDVEDITNEEK